MRVLIVDDDRDVRAILVESFRLSGFDVVAAANGLEALLYVKREQPDAVVLDLMMPRLGGVEALKRIRSYNPGIRVLVVTGNIDPELQRQATAAVAAAPAPEAGAATGRVLVVDDNAEVRMMLEDALTALGYRARTVADGAAAVRAVIDESPDVVLLDVYMPGLSGVGALPTIVALAPHAKVIMISGAANEDVLKR